MTRTDFNKTSNSVIQNITLSYRSKKMQTKSKTFPDVFLHKAMNLPCYDCEWTEQCFNHHNYF